MHQKPNIGENVRYGGHGVCRVERVAEVPFPDHEHMRLCCELRPVSNKGMTILVPVDTEALCAKIKPLFTKEEVDAMLEALPSLPTLWIEDRKQRTMEFRRMISAGDAQTLLQLLRTMEKQQGILRAAKKKLSAADLAAWKDAARVIEEEIAYSLDISTEEAAAYIRRAMPISADA